jgi:hypothetical protein
MGGTNVSEGCNADSDGILAVALRLLALDPSDIGTKEIRSAVTDLRIIRGWVDHLDAHLRQRAKILEGHADQEPLGAETLDLDSGISVREGRRRDGRAKMLSLIPDLAPLLRNGNISVEYLDVLAGVLASLDPAISSRIVEYGKQITHEANTTSVPTFRRFLHRLAQEIASDLGIERQEYQRRATRLRHWIDGATGMGRIHGEFDPDSYQRFISLLDSEVNRHLRFREGLHPDRHRALCLLNLMGPRLVEGDIDGHSPPPISLDILIDAQTLVKGPHPTTICEYADGTPAQIAEVLEAACSADVYPIVVSGASQPLHVGRKIRHATPTQQRALRSIYATCAMPECETPSTRCHAHHILPWEQGGSTDIENLLPLCNRHHHLCHTEKWQLELGPMRELTVSSPDGTVQKSRPDRWPKPKNNPDPIPVATSPG